MTDIKSSYDTFDLVEYLPNYKTNRSVCTLDMFFDMLALKICPEAVPMWDKDLREGFLWKLNGAQLCIYHLFEPWRTDREIYHIVFFNPSGQRAWIKDHWEYVDFHGERVK